MATAKDKPPKAGVPDISPSGWEAFRRYLYAKVEGGFGIGAKVKVGPFKMGVELKRTWEVKNSSEGNTKSEIKEAGAKVEAGGVKVGLSAGTTQVQMVNDQRVDGPATADVTVGYDGGGFQGSNSEVGVGGSLCVVLCGGVEGGVRGDQLLGAIGDAIGNAVSNYVTSQMSPGDFGPNWGDQ